MPEPQQGRDLSAELFGRDMSGELFGTPAVTSTIRDDSGREIPAGPGPAAEKPGFFRGMWDELPNIKQIFGGLAEATAHPLDTIGNLSERQWEMLRKADKAMDSGDYAGAFRHAIEFGIPVLGPAMSDMGDEAKTNLPHAMGRATTFGLMNAAPSPKLLGGLAGRQITKGMKNPNALVADAYDYLSGVGVPIPAGRRSGSNHMMAAEEMGAQTMGGAPIAEAAQAKQAQALKAEAARLANEAHPLPATALTAGEDTSRALQTYSDSVSTALEQSGNNLAGRITPQPVVPLQAGSDLRTAAESRVQGLSQAADQAYEPFHQAAKDPRNARKVVIGRDANAQPIWERMNMPVWIGGLQRTIRPLVREWEMLVEPARRNSSRGFTAMESIINWDKGEWMPADLAEKALGGLKDLARTGKYENKGGADFARAMRDENQGVAGLAVSQLQSAIDQTATKVGPNAINGLQSGRKFTAQQYDIADNVVGKMQQEPVQAYGQMVYAGDSGVDYLKRVAQEVPGEMPKVGRAFFGELQQQAATPAGWRSAKKRWDALGDETKSILYSDPSLRTDIDHFFANGVEHANTDIMRDIAKEPVAVFGQLTAANDAKIGFLQRVESVAPQELPKVGRAYLEGLFDTAAAEGGWTRTQGVFRDWERLGEQSKKLLFPNPMLRANLDKFFLGAKQLAQPMNPSKTALSLVNMKEKGMWIGGLSSAGAGIATGNPLVAAGGIGVPAAFSLSARQLTKLLYSPAGTKLLLEGMRIPATKSPYASVTASKILQLVGEGEDKQNAR